jgi:hypothetical protein
VASWSRDTTAVIMAVCLAVQGFGLGLFQVSYADRVLATLPQADRGVAGSLTLVTRTIGIVGAAAGLTALSRAIEADALAAGLPDATLLAFKQTFALVSAGLAVGLAAVLVGLGLGRAIRPRASRL